MKRPVVVLQDANADKMNILYGEDYGVDWVYPIKSDREREVAKVKALMPFGGKCTVFWHAEGGGEVYRIWDMLFLFSIPQYGGDGSFEGSFHLSEAENLVDMANTWT